ncbi:MAG: redox-regulated ATPase YchF [Candidatus Omnitrophica bacterium]|nr:redox-regulated ATPase YchF [Candidatus Omnitrophota bacterium]
MQIAIIGLPQSGKHTLFQLLTSLHSGSGSKGLAEVHDPRLNKLAELYPNKKKIPAVIELFLLPALTNESEHNQTLFKSLEEVNAICYVIRAFKDETIFHIDGSIDPLRDIKKIDSELLLKDLAFVELRLERLDKEKKKEKRGIQEKERELLLNFKATLEQERFLFTLNLNENEQKIVNNYPLLTLKRKLIVLNVDEDKLEDPNLLRKIESDGNVGAVQISAKIEQELFQLESKEEQEEFLKELGIGEPATHKLTRVAYQLLGLISFFTIGKDEVRAWSVRRGTLAPQAAGKVHSDIERGFIRAQVIKCADLFRLGSKQAVEKAGLALLKGKDYPVEDGDIIDFRFSV